MFLTTHGDEAEAEAARRLHRAEETNDSGEKVTWFEVAKLLPKIRAERAQREN
ncbi:MAG: hypothetical protein JWR80_2732 [Bradyrhizobium sp.]|nr:hypothetical protein [Bradyrhizobium sp.]